MPILRLLTPAEQRKFDSSPQLNQSQKQKFFSLNDDIEDHLAGMRKPVNKVGFLIQFGYFKASAKFFPSEQFREDDVKFVCELLGICDYQNVNLSASSYLPRDKFLHRKVILNQTGWKELNTDLFTEIKEELITYAKNQLPPKTLFSIATQFLLNKNIELPTYYMLAELISAVCNEAEEQLTNIVEQALTPYQKDLLDDIISIDDRRRKHHKYSCLAEIKQMPLSTKLSNILDSMETFKIIKEFYNKFFKVYKALNLSEHATHYYAAWVHKSKLYQLKQFKNKSKTYLYLLAYMQNEYFTRNDAYVDIILKTIGTTLNAIRREKEKQQIIVLKAQKEALTQIFNSYSSSTQILYTIHAVLENKGIDNDQKIKNLKSILNDFIDSKEIITDEDQAKIATLIGRTENKLTAHAQDLKALAASLHRKLSPIIGVLIFDQNTSDQLIINAIKLFTSADENKMYNKAWLTEDEVAISFNVTKKKANILTYKGLLFTKIFNNIKAGKLNLKFSYRYLPINKYFIDDLKWTTDKEFLLELTGLHNFTSFQSVIDNLQAILHDKFITTNQDYIKGVNKHLSFTKTGRLKVATPGIIKINENGPMMSVFSKAGIIPIAQVLDQVNQHTEFVRCFKHHSNKRVKMKPTNDMLYAGIIGKGCNHGLRKMANISKGITEDKLKNVIKWYFTSENLQAASNKIIKLLSNLALPNIYKYDHNIIHTSSDGQKFNVSVDSILANYSFKYFGTEQGISVYSFIDSRQILFYDTVISPTEREAAYVIDGLMANNVIRSSIHSTDTHGYSELIFAITHLLGISFAPRIKRIGAQRLYSIDSTRNYLINECKIRPYSKTNVALMEKSWDDVLRFIVSIKTKTATASQLLKRLNSYTKEHPLYKALKEFGRIIKSIYILTYIDNLHLRQQVYKQLNKIELSNKFSKAVFFANSQEFKTGSTVEQLLMVACKSFIQNCIVSWNYLYLSKMLLDAKTESHKKRLLLFIKQNSVLAWKHINLHGEYDFTIVNDVSNTSTFDWEAIAKLKIA